MKIFRVKIYNRAKGEWLLSVSTGTTDSFIYTKNQNEAGWFEIKDDILSILYLQNQLTIVIVSCIYNEPSL